MLLAAKIIAEAYYDLLRKHVSDPVIHQACTQILKDEVGHLGFHADFLFMDCKMARDLADALAGAVSSNINCHSVGCLG